MAASWPVCGDLSRHEGGAQAGAGILLGMGDKRHLGAVRKSRKRVSCECFPTRLGGRGLAECLIRLLVMDQKQLTTIFCARPQNFAWFLGAGTSRSAGLPTATDIIWDLKRRFYCREENQDISTYSKRRS
jgi:hypothetical protein